MTIWHGSQESAIVKAAKSDNDDTKQLVGSNKKCPQLMALIFDQVLAAHPIEQRSIQIHACLLAIITCTPLMLSNPLWYIKIITQGNQVKYPPEVKNAFKKPGMAALLQHFWGFKLAIERTVDAMIESKYKNSQ